MLDTMSMAETLKSFMFAFGVIGIMKALSFIYEKKPAKIKDEREN